MPGHDQIDASTDNTARSLTVNLPEVLDMRWASYIIGFSIRASYHFERERCEFIARGRWTRREVTSNVGEIDLKFNSTKDTFISISGRPVGSLSRLKKFGKNDYLYLLRSEVRADSPECVYQVTILNVGEGGWYSGSQQAETWHAPAIFLALLQEKIRTKMSSS